MAAKGTTVREDLKVLFDLKKKNIQSLMTNFLDNFEQHRTILDSIKKTGHTAKLVEWIFDNPTCIPHLKRWLSANGGKDIIQKVTKKALEYRSKDNNSKAKDLKFFQTWGNETVDEASFAAFVKFTEEKFQQQEDKMKSHSTQLNNKIKVLSKKVSELKKKVESEKEKRAKTEMHLKAATQKQVIVQEELGKAQAEISKLREELRDQKHQSDKAVQELKEDDLRKMTKIEELERQNAKYRDKIQELEVQLLKSDEKINTLEKKKNAILEIVKGEPSEDDDVSNTFDDVVLTVAK